MNRTTYSIDDILKPVENSANACGEDLSLSTVYDSIKSARFEEDERLSLGVWERDLKKADWELVERLCIDALKNESKDLRILGWLIEALAVLDGLNGICEGIKILKGFVKTYWNDCYPKDEEQKFKILDWIYEATNKRAVSVPFIKDSKNSVSIYDYDYALETKSILIRSPERAKEILDSAAKNNVKTFDEIQNILKSADKENLELIIKNIEELKFEKSELENAIFEITNIKSAAFSKLISNVDKLGKLLSQNKIENEDVKNHNEPKENVLDIREDIYEQIKILAEKLKEIEKHSPSYYMLEMVVSWKDKTLLEIITDLKSGTFEARELFKILLNP